MEGDNRQERDHASARQEVAGAPDAQPSVLRWSIRIAAFSWLLPLAVIVVVVLHSFAIASSSSYATLHRLAEELQLQQLSLTPSGRVPRDGPSSHPAVDLRHGARLVGVDQAASNTLELRP